MPTCLILQLPRSGKDFKMYDKVYISPKLKLNDVLKGGECYVKLVVVIVVILGLKLLLKTQIFCCFVLNTVETECFFCCDAANVRCDECAKSFRCRDRAVIALCNECNEKVYNVTPKTILIHFMHF